MAEVERYAASAAKAGGHDVSKIHSVASFFVSRVDTEVDKRLEKIGTDEALALRGTEQRVYVRVAAVPDAVYIDLGDPTWQIVHIDATGWRLVTDAVHRATGRVPSARSPAP